MGKLKRDSFLEVIKNPGDETDRDTFRDQIKTGKLNVSDLYPNDQKEDFVRGEIKIGKIKTKVTLVKEGWFSIGPIINILDSNYGVTYYFQELFNNKENEQTPLEKPKMKIGKLDPKNLFDKSAESEYLEKEKEMFNNIVIGKLNTNNIFENDQIKEVEKKTVQVGKIKTKVILIYHKVFYL